MTLEEQIAKARAIIEAAGSRFISVEFLKKDNSTRKMQVHPTAIQNRLVGDAASEAAKQAVATRKETHPELYPVVDVAASRDGEEKAIRSINLKRLIAITVDGQRHEFGDGRQFD